MKQPNDPTNNVIQFYNNYDEQARLTDSLGRVEFIRTQNIIRRYLNSPPGIVLDVGGAAGRYACWLAKEGYEVHLVDPVPLHIQQARQASAQQPASPVASCTLGDARQLEFGDQIADAVLLLGPLYHLVEAQDRQSALTEAYRVLKTGGVVFAAGISRFASAIEGLVSEHYLDPLFQNIIRQDLETGQHQNPTNHPEYFMDTFFHHPSELQAEVGQAGFNTLCLLAVEGISYLMKDFDQSWQIEDRREFMLEILAKTESEPSLLGASPHILCVGVKL